MRPPHNQENISKKMGKIDGLSLQGFRLLIKLDLR
jgi:hypothetical protein